MKFWKGQIFYSPASSKKNFVQRSLIITSNLINKTIKIYNGKIYRFLIVRKKFLLNKAGSLFFTKKKSLYLKAKIKKKKNKLRKK